MVQEGWEQKVLETRAQVEKVIDQLNLAVQEMRTLLAESRALLASVNTTLAIKID